MAKTYPNLRPPLSKEEREYLERISALARAQGREQSNSQVKEHGQRCPGCGAPMQGTTCKYCTA